MVCFPGQNQIVDWVSHVLAVGALTCVVTPQWHGPAMSALKNHRVAQQQMGPAFSAFVGDGEILAWLMVATLQITKQRKFVPTGPRSQIHRAIISGRGRGWLALRWRLGALGSTPGPRAREERWRNRL